MVRWTALHEACNHGFRDIAETLLDNGADVNAKGMDDERPLHDAAINSHAEVVQLLLSRGANVVSCHLEVPAASVCPSSPTC